MDKYSQLIPFIFSFFYGIIFFLFKKVVNYMLINKKLLTSFLVYFVFVIDYVLLYVYFMYKINNGNHHIYYIAVLILGFFAGSKTLKKCKYFVNLIKHR